MFDLGCYDDAQKSFKKIKEFRRGTSSKIVKDISFGFDNEFLSVCTNSETVHIFYFRESNIRSRLNVLGFFNSYLDSEWSKVQIKIPPNEDSFIVMEKGCPREFYLFLRKGLFRHIRLSESNSTSLILGDFTELEKMIKIPLRGNL